MQKLMPDSKGKAILDIGCGYGHNCLHFAENGAAHVTGIDISEKMLKEARRNYAHPVITYMRMDMAELGTLNNSYDLVYSSLASIMLKISLPWYMIFISCYDRVASFCFHKCIQL